MRILVATALLVAGCREPIATDDDRVELRKTVEPDDDFVHTRNAYEIQMRSRLAQLDTRINELGEEASVRLRALRDRLATEVDKIDEQGEVVWDTFRSQLERSFNEVERDLTAP